MKILVNCNPSLKQAPAFHPDPDILLAEVYDNQTSTACVFHSRALSFQLATVPLSRVLPPNSFFLGGGTVTTHPFKIYSAAMQVSLWFLTVPV